MKNIIVVSDTHCGCQLGLCARKIRLDNDNYYEPSKNQKIVYRWWQHFWNNWVPMVTKGEDYIIVHNGDAIDGDHHGAKTPISTNYNIQLRIAEQCLMPQIEKPNCKAYYHIRGTESHVGKSAEYEEMLAERLGAKPTKNGQYARWELWYELGHTLVHFSHHIGTTQSSAYESTAVYKEMVEAFNEAGRWQNRPPDVIVRSHRHRQFETRIGSASGYGISLVTPGWQLKTPYTYRLASGRSGTPQMGGYLIRIGDEDSIFTRFKMYKIERSIAEKD